MTPGIRVTPSQGSHFFQNLTSFQVGYFTVNPELGEGTVDWDWLAAQPARAEDGHVRRLAFDRPPQGHPVRIHRHPQRQGRQADGKVDGALPGRQSIHLRFGN